MKQGEILKEYANSKGLSVNKLKNALGKDSSGIYALFRTKQFSQSNYDLITGLYPDFSEFESRFNFQNAKKENIIKGHSAEDPAPLDAGQLAHMILSNSSVSLASYELLCRAVSILEKRPLEKVLEESNQVVHDKMSTFEKLLKEMISLP